MKQSKRQREIEARRAADPIAQALGREDIDYTTDELPTAPRQVVRAVECGHDWMRVFPSDDPRPLEVCTKCEAVRNETTIRR